MDTVVSRSTLGQEGALTFGVCVPCAMHGSYSPTAVYRRRVLYNGVESLSYICHLHTLVSEPYPGAVILPLSEPAPTVELPESRVQSRLSGVR